MFLYHYIKFIISSTRYVYHDTQHNTIHVTLFLAGSSLAAVASNPNQDPLSVTNSGVNVSATDTSKPVIKKSMLTTPLMVRGIASLMRNFYKLAILSSAGSNSRNAVYEMMQIELSLHLLISLKGKDFLQLKKIFNKTEDNLTFFDGVTKIHINYSTLLNFVAVKSLSNLLITKNEDEKITILVKSLENVTTIENHFLSFFCGLEILDLSSLSKVTSIGKNFLSDCIDLTELNLSGLSKVTNIEGGFLSDSTDLTTLDLSPLSNLTSIGKNFLSGCSALTTLDLSPLSKVTTIKGGFLYYCKGLEILDLSPLSNVTNIGEHFISHCSALTTLDLSPLSNVTNIESHFLCCCIGLTSVTVQNSSHLKKQLENFVNKWAVNPSDFKVRTGCGSLGCVA